MQTQKRKTNIRYDETFKESAIKMVTEQKIPVPQAAKTLGIIDDTLRNWLKKTGLNPKNWCSYDNQPCIYAKTQISIYVIKSRFRKL